MNDRDLESLTPEQRQLFQKLRARTEARDFSPLAYSQVRCWRHQEQFPQSWLFNLPIVLRLKGVLDVDGLCQSFRLLVKRHPALTLQLDAQTGLQKIGVAPRLEIEPTPGGESEARQRVQTLAQQPFDLAAGPLVRAHLLELSRNERILVLVLHGFVSDCFSARILLQDWSHLYRLDCLGDVQALPDLPTSYFELARAQAGKDRKESMDFWKSELEGLTGIAEIRPEIPLLDRHHLDASLTTLLTEVASRNHATLFMLLVTTLLRLQVAANPDQEPCLGIIVSCRSQSDSEGVVGPFANYLVVRDRGAGSAPLEHLVKTRRSLLRCQTHQEVLFEELYAPKTTVPIQTLFVFHQSATEDILNLPGITVQRFDVLSTPIGMPVEISCVARNGGLDWSIRYRDDWKDSRLVEQLRRLPEWFQDWNQESPDLRSEVSFDDQQSVAEPQHLQQLVQQALAEVLVIRSEQVAPERSFFQLGLDSLTAMRFRHELEKRLNRALPEEILFDYPTCQGLSDWLEVSHYRSNPQQTPLAPRTRRPGAEALATLALLFLLCLPVAFGMLGFQSKGLRENRRLERRPAWQGWMPAQIQRFAKKFENYWNDHFPLRSTLIRVQARLLYEVFDTTIDPEIIVGLHGWLFDAKLTGAKLTSLHARADWEPTRKSLEQARDRLAREGIALVVVFTPEKDETYSEHLPASQRKGMERYLAGRGGLREYLKSRSDLTIVDLAEPVRADKAQHRVFSVTDRHWTALGALAGVSHLQGALRSRFPDLPQLQRTDYRQGHRLWTGGEARKTALDHLREEQVTLEPENLRFQLIGVPSEKISGNDEFHKDYASQSSAVHLPRAVVFRNSMCNQMVPFLATMFQRVRYVHHSVACLTFVEEEQPDLVILALAPAALPGFPGTDKRIHQDLGVWNQKASKAEWFISKPEELAESAGENHGWRLESSIPRRLTYPAPSQGPSQVVLADIEADRPATVTLSWWQQGQRYSAARGVQSGRQRLRWTLSTDRPFELTLSPGGYLLKSVQWKALQLPDQGAPGVVQSDDSDQAFLAILEEENGRIPGVKGRLFYCNQYRKVEVDPRRRIFQALFQKSGGQGACYIDYYLASGDGSWTILDRRIQTDIEQRCPNHPQVVTRWSKRCCFCNQLLLPDLGDGQPAAQHLDVPEDIVHRIQPGLELSALGPARGRSKRQSRRPGKHYKVVVESLSGQATRVSDTEIIVPARCRLQARDELLAVDIYLAKTEGWRIVASWTRGYSEHRCRTHPAVWSQTQRDCPFDQLPLEPVSP